MPAWRFVTQIVEITAADTHDLRRRVLRDGTPSDVVVWDGDDDPSTVHLGVRRGDELVAIASWMRRPHPDRPTVDAFQLRGMATDPARRGTGLGAALLSEGVERCRAAGVTLVWARARATALTFYVRHHFEPVGPEYLDATTGLVHRDIVREL
jgi:GNAT superfamily N-acetyltransferase